MPKAYMKSKILKSSKLKATIIGSGLAIIG